MGSPRHTLPKTRQRWQIVVRIGENIDATPIVEVYDEAPAARRALALHAQSDKDVVFLQMRRFNETVTED